MTDVNATETNIQGVKQPVCKALVMQVQRKPVCYNLKTFVVQITWFTLYLTVWADIFLITLYVHNNSRDWDVSVQSGPSSSDLSVQQQRIKLCYSNG